MKTTTTVNKFRKALTGILVIGAGFLISPVYGQAPQAIKYQGVARDNVGNELTFQNLGLRLSIVADSADGTVVYSETHDSSTNATTNEFGLFNVEIGNGTTTDDFTAIDWGSTTHYLKVEMDDTGGTGYQEMGTSQLLAVPYALYADSAGAAPGSTPQTLTFAGGSLSISAGNTVTIPDSVNDLDADPLNEIQTLTLAGSDLTISGGNTVTLSSTAPSDTSLYADSAGFADTANYAWYADMAAYADTATYAWSAASSDTANFAYDADTATYAWSAAFSDTANFAYDADTANYAWLAASSDTANFAYDADTANYAWLAASSDTANFAYDADTANFAWAAAGADSAYFAFDADTANYAWLAAAADSAYFAFDADTANYAWSALNADTANIAFAAGFANLAQNANYADTAKYADTAGFALGPWGQSGTDIFYTQGNVGIGTTIPDGKLVVRQTGAGDIFNLYDNTTNVFTVLDGGDVGIGTTTPQNRLDVEGGVAIGATYSGTNVAPVNGLLVEGNVGIGTDAPLAKLNVAGVDQYTAHIAISNYANNAIDPRFSLLKSRGTTVGANVIVQQNDITGQIFGWGADGSSYWPTSSIQFAVDGTPGTADMPGRLVFSTTADGNQVVTERMRINKDGNVGIGTSAPTQKLHVQGSDADITGVTGVLVNISNIAGGTDGTMSGIRFNNYNGTTANKGAIFYQRNQGFGIGDIHFAINSVFDASDVTKADAIMTIRSTGNVGIGTTSPQFPLSVASSTALRTAYFYNDANSTSTTFGLWAGAFGAGSGDKYAIAVDVFGGTGLNMGVRAYASGGSTAYGVWGYATGASSGTNWAIYSLGNSFATGTWGVSDSRLKINVAGFDGALSRIGQLPVKTYHFDNEKYPTFNFPTQQQYGIMAQDLEKVFPEMVLESDHPIPGENGEMTEETVEIKAVNYVQLIPVLVKAVQEQQVIIESQKVELETLKAEMSEIKAIVQERADNE